MKMLLHDTQQVRLATGLAAYTKQGSNRQFTSAKNLGIYSARLILLSGHVVIVKPYGHIMI